MSKLLHRPPRWAERLLQWACRPDYVDEVLGDLHEAYYWRLEEKGHRKAAFNFVLEVLLSLRFTHLKPFYHFNLNTMMLGSYLKIAFRNLYKRKAYSVINILGLSVGVAASLMIFMYAWQVLTFDDFHTNEDRIFMLYKERITPNGIQPTYDTWVPMKSMIKEEYPQVVASTRRFQMTGKVKRDEAYIEEEVTFADPEFLQIFSFEVGRGNSTNPFSSPNALVISSQYAEKYFGSQQAVGRELSVYYPGEDSTIRYEVTAVLKDWPDNSSLEPDMIVAFESLPFYEGVKNLWGGSFIDNYVMLDDPASKYALLDAFPAFVEKIWDKEIAGRTNFKLLPFDEYYNTFLGSQQDAKILVFIALGILLMAAINFMNLSTAHSVHRAKEIGLRKVLGAFSGQLRGQFLVEALVLSFFATLAGIGIVALCMPLINDFFDIEIAFSQIGPPMLSVGFVAAFILLLGLMSGSYPAFFLAKINILEVIRGIFKTKGGRQVRNGLVVVQFSLAVFMVTGALIVRNQLIYMQSAKMGFEKDAVVIINASRRDFTDREEASRRLKTFRDEVKAQSFVKSASLSYSIPSNWVAGFTFVRPEGWEGDPLRMGMSYVDANYLETMGIKLRDGRNFLPDSEGDQRGSVILNEAAAKAFGFDSAEGNVILIGENRLNVVGVVENFHYESMREEIKPTLIFHRTAENPVHRYIVCKMEMADISNHLSVLEGQWSALGAANSFTYNFLDDSMAELYTSEQRFLRLVGLFTIISILIAVLGLYGLTIFVIERKRREISIRKVIGADVSNIVLLVVRDFSSWIAGGLIIGLPLAYIFLRDWLDQFHYRIDISWTVFLFTAGMITTLVMLTVSYQAIRAASANPVKYLKED
ncbi:MAG: ABC transporter permease [Imperialibacter sp.]|uniref:ABC transporter permease n=1 Tax=Imperialibacter sp. TaxID=2038411 RepID=UPI0032EB3442